MRAINKYILLIIALTFGTLGCQEGFLDTEPSEYISDEQLSKSAAANEAIVNGIYGGLRSFALGDPDNGFHIDYGLMSTKNATDMMSHDVTQPVSHWFIFYANYDGRVQTSSRSRLLWNTFYSQILSANTVISALTDNTDTEEAEHILGQALTLRSLCYHYLIRLYAVPYSADPNAPGIPIYEGPSFEGQPRSSVGDVYELIAGDLEAAVGFLEGFSRGNKQQIDQNVANGLLAEVYLDMERWEGAENAAMAAREGYSLMSAQDWVEGGFSDISNGEWIWGADIDGESSTVFASFFSHFDTRNNGYAGALGVYKMIDANLYSLIPDSDERKKAFIGPEGEGEGDAFIPGYVNLKFHDPTFFEGDYVYMRAAEMYLIEAEAKARQDDPEAAQVLYDLVITRDPDYTLSTSTGQDLVDEIYLQRRIELWGEGYAWFDLKRLGLPLERDYEGSNHIEAGRFDLPVGSKDFQFQIPEDEITANEQISSADQNP